MALLRRFYSSTGNIKIFRTFRAMDLDGKTEVVYRIQSFPRDRIEEAILFNRNYFLKHEPMTKTRNAANDPAAAEEFLELLRKSMKKGVSLACFKKNSDEIIATNIMAVKTEVEYMEEPNVS